MNKKIKVFVIIITLLVLSSIAPVATSIKISNAQKQNLEEINNIQSIGGLPSYFNWRDRNGVDYTTPIRDQSPLSSCETFSLVAAIESMIQIKLNLSFDCDLSEAHLWFNSEPNLRYGSYPDNNLKYLKNHGIPDEACWPYPSEKEMYAPNSTCDCWKNRSVKITGWEFLPAEQTAIKNALINYGPIPTFIICYQDFMLYRGGIYRHNWGKAIEPHMVTIVGYNDDPGYWIVKNSWGTKWGENGWFRIEYGQNSIEEYSILIKDVCGKFPITYVDDDNSISPFDGTKENPYKTIQQGIDNSYSGYTLYVQNGLYEENIIVNKTLKIFGEDKINTIVDGKGEKNVITILSENVEISGFTIQNSGSNELDAGIGIQSKTVMTDANATINQNIIHKNKIGVHSYISCSNILRNNCIKNNDIGIYFFMSINNLIQENNISNNKIYGIKSEWGQGNYIGNIVDSNNKSGIYLRGGSSKNMIKEGNTIKNNDIGIKIFHSNKNVISGNNFINNDKHATFIDSYQTKWIRNYWDDHEKIFPKIIKGIIGKNEITWLNFDWLPSKNPL